MRSRAKSTRRVPRLRSFSASRQPPPLMPDQPRPVGGLRPVGIGGRQSGIEQRILIAQAPAAGAAPLERGVREIPELGIALLPPRELLARPAGVLEHQHQPSGEHEYAAGSGNRPDD